MSWIKLGMVAAAASLALFTAGCDDACWQFCEETVVCNTAADHPDYETDVEDCYQTYVDQGVGDPVLGAGIEESCRVSLEAWEGCPTS